MRQPVLLKDNMKPINPESSSEDFKIDPTHEYMKDWISYGSDIYT